MVIDVRILRKNGQVYTTSRTVNSQSDLSYYNTELEKSVKAYIDNDTVNSPTPTPTHPQNHAVSYTTRVTNYY